MLCSHVPADASDESNAEQKSLLDCTYDDFLMEEVHKNLVLYEKRAEMLIAGRMNEIAPL